MKNFSLATCLLIVAAIIMNARQPEFPKLPGPYLGQKPPGMTPEIFAPGIISTNSDEYGIAFTPDGNEFYFTRMGGALSQSTIMVMKQEWSGPRVASFSGTYADSEPFITPDGKKLYFGSRRPLEDNETPKRPSIWVTDRTDSAWPKPRPLGSPFQDIYYVSNFNKGRHPLLHRPRRDPQIRIHQQWLWRN